MSKVRTPPPYSCQPKGTCKLCAKPIVKDDGTPDVRVSWHSECVEIWKIATSSEAARAAVLARDQGICRECGFDCNGPTNWRPQRRYDHGEFRYGYATTWIVWVRVVDYHADHVRPLWSVDRTDPNCLRFWMLENLALVCQPCHAKKTAIEAGQRAKEKRIRNKAAGIKTKKFTRKIPSRPFSKTHRPLRRKA